MRGSSSGSLDEGHLKRQEKDEDGETEDGEVQ